MDINKLKEHLENTPIEQLREEWKEVEQWATVEPKAQELIKLFSLAYVSVTVCPACGHNKTIQNYAKTERKCDKCNVIWQTER